MNSFFTIIKSDYLQRTRSYTFLITLCISLAIAYTIIPEPSANYSTIRIADYVGEYNAAWFGYASAIMTSLFLSLIGFYLINTSIKTDIETKVGEIISSTKIGNFNYLLSKVFSNFLVLLTILAICFFMSILLFFLYNEGYSFEIFQFIKPYAIITVPTLFLIAVLAVLFEVFLGRYSVLQNIGFFCLFSVLMLTSRNTQRSFSLDIFGSTIVMHQLEKEVRLITKADKQTDLTIGYIIGNVKETKKFLFNGMEFPTSFIISRFIWIFLGVGAIWLSSLFFHRFNVKERIVTKKESKTILPASFLKDISLTNLPTITINYGVFSLLKTELILLSRKGKKWLWGFNFLGMILLVTVPITGAHQFVLPVLWFLQVGRLSEITTKEIQNNVHYFAFASYKPLTRLLTSQIVAGILLVLFLASPLLIRLGIAGNIQAIISVILGGVFVVAFATVSGIITRSKKLFEVLFFMITYTNINGIPFTDYFGGLPHESFYTAKISGTIVLLLVFSFLIRTYQLKKL